jgi:hypothetical protein
LWGSQVYLEASIEALGRAVDEFHKLRSSGENSAEVISCLESINSFLKEMESNEGAQMREECSKVRCKVDWIALFGTTYLTSPFFLVDHAFSLAVKAFRKGGPFVS